MTHRNVGTEDESEHDMDGLVPNLEIDNDADYLFEGFSMVANTSTKSYLEDSIITLTWADRSVTNGLINKAFHQHHCSIPTSYILLGNQSTGDVF